MNELCFRLLMLLDEGIAFKVGNSLILLNSGLDYLKQGSSFWFRQFRQDSIEVKPCLGYNAGRARCLIYLLPRDLP
jgi:hypothetical protein